MRKTRPLELDPPWSGLVLGASGGIGHEVCRLLLAQSGLRRLWGSHRSEEPAEELRSLIDRSGGRLRAVRVDLTEPSTLESSARQIVESDGELRLIFDATGFLHGDGFEPERKLDDLSSEALQHAFAINAIGPLLALRAHHELIPRRGRALIASLSARVGSIGDNRLGGWYAYRMSKAALNMGLRGAAIELGRRNRELVCVALHPGTVDTALSEPFLGNVDPEKLFSPERAAAQLLDVLAGLGPEDSGGFFAWDGEPISW